MAAALDFFGPVLFLIVLGVVFLAPAMREQAARDARDDILNAAKELNR